MSPRPPCARNRNAGIIFSVMGCGRHGPDPRLTAWVPPVVGTPRRSYGYAFGAPPRIWSHGARNEAHHTCAELP
jgi:hypothetical protein